LLVKDGLYLQIDNENITNIMETKNLGLVKAMFVQPTSPVRTDVWWYDTINAILKYWDAGTLQWKQVTAGGGGASVTYTQISIPANSSIDISIGLASAVKALLVEYVGERGALAVEGCGRCLISGSSPYAVMTDEQGDSATIGITYYVVTSGANLVLRVIADNSSTYAYNFSYRIETKPKYV
jgi:hypothetical protein